MKSFSNDTWQHGNPKRIETMLTSVKLQIAQWYRAPLFWILLTGVVVRLLLWSWFYGRSPEIFDEKYLYSAIAENLVQHGEFADEPRHVTSKRPPLYPAFLALCYRLFGVDNYDAVRLLQALISLGTVVFLYRIGCRIYSERVGWWAALFCCFYPSLLVYNNLLLAEVLFTFLLCAGVFLLVLFIQQNQLRWLAAGSVVLALAAMTRSILWLYPPVFVVLLMLQRECNWRRRLMESSVFVLVFAATLAPWAVRNTLLQKTLVVVDATGGRNFMMGNYRDTPLNRPWDGIGLQGEQAWYQQIERPAEESVELTQGQIDKLALRAGLRFIATHPRLTAKRDVLKFFHFWQLERELVAGATQNYFGPIPTWGIILSAITILATYVASVLGGLFGILLTPPADRRIHGMLLSFLLFVTGMHMLAFGHSRYHLPLMPLLFLYAGSALVQCRQMWSMRFRPMFYLGLILSGVLISSWTWEIAVVERERLANMKR